MKTMQRLLMLLVPVVLSGCSNTYPSKTEADQAKTKWIEAGGAFSYAHSRRPTWGEWQKSCDSHISSCYDRLPDIPEVTDLNRRWCVVETETNQFLCYQYPVKKNELVNKEDLDKQGKEWQVVKRFRW